MPGSLFYHQSLFNFRPDANKETEKEEVEKHKSFVEKHAEEIKHFGKT